MGEHTSHSSLGNRIRGEHVLPLQQFVTRKSYHWFVVATVCVGAFMAALDASIVTVALPTLVHAFHQSMSNIEWVAVAYLLTLTALLTMFGRIADMVGRRQMYTAGFSVFIIGSALCGAAVSLPMLLISRVLQASGAAMLQANSVAIITAAVPSEQRGKAIGFQGSAQAIGLSLGPAIGGVLIAWLGWRSIFYVNVPVGIIGTILAALILPRDHVNHVRQRFDYLGAILMAPALVFLLLALSDGNAKGWLSSAILLDLGLAVGLGVAFYFWEKLNSSPLVDLRLFKIGIFTWGNISGLLSYAVMFGVLFLTPFYLERLGRFEPASTGVLLTPVPIAMMLIAPMSGHWADRFGGKMLTVVGMVLSAVGAGILIFVTKQPNLMQIIVGLALVGFGLGLFTPPNNSSVMGSVPKERLGVAGGILNMARSLGMSLGVTFAGALYGIFMIMHHQNPDAETGHGLLTSFRGTFVGITVLAIVTVLISFLRGEVKHKPNEKIEHEPLEW